MHVMNEARDILQAGRQAGWTATGLTPTLLLTHAGWPWMVEVKDERASERASKQRPALDYTLANVSRSAGRAGALKLEVVCALLLVPRTAGRASPMAMLMPMPNVHPPSIQTIPTHAMPCRPAHAPPAQAPAQPWSLGDSPYIFTLLCSLPLP